MKFTLKWLKDFLDTQATPLEIVTALTSLGLEAEIGDEKQKQQLSPFIIAQIEAVEPHPNADRLKVCVINTGSNQLQIVCGAHNARTGLKVVLAPVGSIVPQNQLQIRKSKIRGIESAGMLCSFAELGIKDRADDGIIEVQEDTVVGSSLLDYLGINDTVIEVSITPNRSDCLSVLGLARELAAKKLGVLKALSINEAIEWQDNAKMPLSSIHNSKLLLVSMAISPGIASPAWLANRLRAIGQQPISAVVDITNYICYSYGQPMHAYDAEQLQGSLKLSTIDGSAEITALDSRRYLLESTDLVIQDEAGTVHSLAGIIGCQNSSCTLQTQNIILEAGVFNQQRIRKTAGRLKINTAAKYRFERGIDPEFCELAMGIAIEMIEQICQGELIAANASSNTQASPISIECSLTNFHNKIGLDMDGIEACHHLKNLGFIAEARGDILNVKVPSWRLDVENSEDIFEELIRIKGYEHIPMQNFMVQHNTNLVSVIDKTKISRQALASLGYNELVSWSFTSSRSANCFTVLHPSLKIKNPLSSELDYLRPSILTSLLEAAAANQQRFLKDIALFEIGPIFSINDECKDIIERLSVSAVRTGYNCERNPHDARHLVDIFDLKGDINVLLDSLGIDYYVEAQAPSYFHAKRSGTLKMAGREIGYFGQLDPLTLKHYQIDNQVVGLELFLDHCEPVAKKLNQHLSDHPYVKRDLALVVPAKVNIEAIIKTLKDLDQRIKRVKLFDIYRSNDLALEQVSLAFSFTLQADDHTLIESEIEELMKMIINQLAMKFAAKVRTAP